MGASNSKIRRKTKVTHKTNKPLASPVDTLQNKTNFHSNTMEFSITPDKNKELETCRKTYCSQQTVDPGANQTQGNSSTALYSSTAMKAAVGHIVKDSIARTESLPVVSTTELCNDNRINVKMESGTEIHERLITRDSENKTLSKDFISDTYDQDYHTLCSNNGEETLQQYEIYEQIKAGNVCVNIRTSVKSQCSMDTSIIESGIFPEISSDDVFCDIQNEDINDTELLPDPKDYGNDCLDRHTAVRSQYDVTFNDDLGMDTNRPPNDSDSNEDSGIYDGVEPNVVANSDSGDYGLDVHTQRSDSDECRKRTDSNTPSLMASHSCPEFHQLHQISTGSTFPPPLYREMSEDIQNLDGITRHHMDLPTHPDNLYNEKFRHTTSLLPTYSHHCNEAGSKETETYQKDERCPNPKGENKSGPILKGEGESGPDISNDDESGPDLSNGDESGSDVSDGEDIPILCDSEVVYHDEQPTLHLSPAHHTTASPSKDVSAGQILHPNQPDNGVAYSGNETSSKHRDTDQPISVFITSESSKESTVPDQISATLTLARACDVTVEENNNNRCDADLECLLCGDEASESHNVHSDVKNNLIVKQCGHVICEQCCDDYILTDPEAGIQSNACPFCAGS